MPKCDFNKVALQILLKIKLWHRCSPVNLLHIFRNPFSKNTCGGLQFSWFLQLCFCCHSKRNNIPLISRAEDDGIFYRVKNTMVKIMVFSTEM